MAYKWQMHGDPTNPKVAIIATSSGYRGQLVEDKVIEKRITLLQEMGLCVMVPKYEDGTIVMEPGLDQVYSAIGGKGGPIYQRAVSAKTGCAQIMDCVKNGWNIMSLMGGLGFEDKVPLVHAYCNSPDFEPPKEPIQIFGFSDVSYGAYLQSHFPDVFRFCATPVSYIISRGDLKPEGIDVEDFEQYKEMREELLDQYQHLLTSSELPGISSREYLGDGRVEEDKEKVQYLLLHADLIVSDSTSRECTPDLAEDSLAYKMSRKGIDVPKINTSRPYVIGFEGFLQYPKDFYRYDHNFAQDLDKFLAKRAENGELPIAVEIGAFTTRLDGGHGYGSMKLLDEETGLIAISPLNIARAMEFKDKITKQLQGIMSFKASEDIEEGYNLTTIPAEVEAKISEGTELDEHDMIAVLEHENEKILKLQELVKEVCKKYNVPVIANFRYSHCLNMGVIGGGVVNVRAKETQLELEPVPNHIKLEEVPKSLPRLSPEPTSYDKPTVSSIVKSSDPDALEKAAKHDRRFAKTLEEARKRKERDEELYHLSR